MVRAVHWSFPLKQRSWWRHLLMSWTVFLVISPSGFDHSQLVAAGTLSESLGTISIGSTVLTATNKTINYTIPITVIDLTGLQLGWNIEVTSTLFSTGGGSPKTLPATAAVIQGVTSVCAGLCTLPFNTVSYPLTIPSATVAPASVKMANATALSGIGGSTLTTTVSLTIPANSYAGVYTSTLTLTIAPGP